MKHTIFPANRKRLLAPAYVDVLLIDHYWKKNVRYHFVYHSREKRDASATGGRHKLLYRLNVHPKVM